MAGVPLLQVPPGVRSLSVTLLPTHRLAVPVIAAGDVVTLTVFDVAQPPTV
jgi:hypothetical protein